MDDLTPEERMEVELSTAIDPFKAPKPWVRKRLKGGSMVYYNEITKEQQTHHPGQVKGGGGGAGGGGGWLGDLIGG